MLELEAQFEASCAETSRPSGAIVARNCEPNPNGALADVDDASDEGNGCVVFELMLEGVPGGKELGPVSVSIRFPVSAKSTLFPTNMHVRFGLASARASFTKDGRAVNVLWDVIS